MELHNFATKEVVNVISLQPLSLSQQLNVSARASLKYGVFASGSLKTSFFSDFKQNSFSVYVFVQTVVINKQTLLDLTKVKLKDTAAALFVSSPQNFAQQYGDSFIYGLITGGEFLGILEIQSSSASEFREIKAKLSGKGSYGLFSGGASGSFEQSLRSITSEYQMKATILRQGGSGAVLSSVTSNELIQKALSFPGEVKNDKGYPYIALAIPYNHIERPVASPIDLSNQTATLERLGGLRDRFLKYQNDLQFALDHQDQFPGIDITKTGERYNEISAEVSKVVDAARSCFTDLTKCSIPSVDLSLLENILPPQTKGEPDDMVKIFVQSVVVGTGANPPSSAGSHDYTFTPPGSTRVLGGWWSLQDDASGSDAFKQFAIQGTTGTGGGDDVPTPNGNSITFRVKKQNNNSGLIRLAFYVAYV